MFTRQLIAAAALMAASFAANADVISTTSASALASDMSIVDTSTSLTGADTGLAGILASSNTSLVRGVEGLYMLAARATTLAETGSADIIVPSTDPLAIDVPVVNADLPVVNAAEVPEPATLALMLAGVLGAAGFTRARKQG